MLEHLLRRSVAETFRARLGGADLSALVERFEEGGTVESGDLVTAADLLDADRPARGTGCAGDPTRRRPEAETPGVVAAAVELALEGLYLNRRISKDEVPGRTVYGGG